MWKHENFEEIEIQFEFNSQWESVRASEQIYILIDWILIQLSYSRFRLEKVSNNIIIKVVWV